MKLFKLHSVIVPVALLLLFFALPLSAQGFDYNQIGISVSAEPSSVPPGSSGLLKITLDAPFGYTITDVEGVFGILVMGDVPGVTFGDLQKPPPDRVDEIGGHFMGATEFSLPFSVASDAAAGERVITLGFQLQACDDSTGVCFFPTSPEDVQREITITIDSSAPAAVETREQGEASSGQDAVTGEQSSDAGSQSLEDQFQSALTGGNLLLAFLLAFLAGIISSLTPCVYPMIPITISYVSGRSEGRKRNGFFISLVLVLGIAITYSVLGVVAGLTGSTFGSYLNHPIVQGFLFIVLVAMGLSMLGVWEIALPASIQNKANVQKKGYLGALGVGLTLGIIAAPCVGPILIGMLVFIANTRDLLLGFLLMFTYAVGMGLLFIFVGTFSNAVLPRSGEWMIWLKKIFAFIFFLMAVIYAQGLINSVPIPYMSQYVIGVVLVIWGTVIGAFVRIEREAGWWQLLGKSFGVLLVVAGLIIFSAGLVRQYLPAFAMGSAEGSDSVKTYRSPAWTTEFEAGMQQGVDEGKPVIVDIWATWCVACFELDEYTFSDPAVISELGRFVAIKVDGSSDADPAYQNVKSHFAELGHGIYGLPAVFIINSDGEVETVINRFEDAKTMLAKLQAVK